MKGNRGARQRMHTTAFELTPAEQRAMALVDQGKNGREIGELLGMRQGQVSCLITNATEKVRLQRLKDFNFSHGSSLSVARGAIRMTGTR